MSSCWPACSMTTPSPSDSHGVSSNGTPSSRSPPKTVSTSSKYSRAHPLDSPHYSASFNTNRKGHDGDHRTIDGVGPTRTGYSESPQSEAACHAAPGRICLALSEPALPNGCSGAAASLAPRPLSSGGLGTPRSRPPNPHAVSSPGAYALARRNPMVSGRVLGLEVPSFGRPVWPIDGRCHWWSVAAARGCHPTTLDCPQVRDVEAAPKGSRAGEAGSARRRRTPRSSGPGGTASQELTRSGISSPSAR
jgi:hypothetical protein